MKCYFSRLFALNCMLFLLTCRLGVLAQTSSPRLSASAALGLPTTFFGVNSKLMGIYTGAVRYSFNKTWSLETRLTAHTFFNNATGNAKKSKLDGTASDVLSFRTPTYGLNAIVYYNLHTIFGLDKKPDARWLPFVSLGLGLNWYKPTVSFATGTGVNANSFGAPYRDYQLGLGSRYYLNHLIDLYAGAEYHYAQTYYLDGLKETSSPSLDTYLNFYAGMSVKLGAKKHANLIDWAHKNIEKEMDEPKDYSKWAVDATLGLPVLISPVGYNTTGMLGLGLRHSFNNFLSGQINFGYGNLAGSQESTGTPAVGSSEYVKSFTTTISQITGRLLVNIRSAVAEPSNRTKWNHYAVLGAGYTNASGDASFADGRTVSAGKLSMFPGIQTIVIGYQARKYLNPHFDLIGGLDFNYNGSKYLDQAYKNSSTDNHVYIHTGITYKIGTSKDREHIDWAYQNYNNYKNRKTVLQQVPVIERPAIEEPKIEVIPVEVAAKPAGEGSQSTDTTAAQVVVSPSMPDSIQSAIKAESVNPSTETVPNAVPVTKPVPAPATTASPATVAPVSRVKPSSGKASEAAAVTEPTRKTKPYIATYEVAPPPAKYNVIVGCYSVNKLSVAKNTQDRLALKGYSPSIYRSSTNSKMLRLAVISTDDKAEARRVLRKARKEIEADAWLYLYNAQ